jgi:hypothetical protein
MLLVSASGSSITPSNKGGLEGSKAQLKPGKLINAIYIRSLIYIYLFAPQI